MLTAVYIIERFQDDLPVSSRYAGDNYEDAVQLLADHKGDYRLRVVYHLP